MHEFPLVELDEIESFDSTRTQILTVNNRYARRILAVLQEQLSAERKAVAVPDIIPVGAWLRSIADELCFSEHFEPASYLLDNFGTIQLWEQVITDLEREERVLLDIRQAARLACEADNLLDEWEIEVVPGEESPDYLQFLRWRERYQAMLLDIDADDSNRSSQRVRLVCESGVYQPSFDTLVLAGFHELSPRLTAIFTALQHQGVRVLSLASMRQTPIRAEVVAAADSDHEWRLAAAWAVQQLRANPRHRVAIVAAQLEADVPYVHRVLAHACAATESQPALAWNVAVGRALSDWSLVRAALAWLQALAQMGRYQQAEPEVLGAALLAGACAGSTDEAGARAQIDAMWRHDSALRVEANEFQALLLKHTPLLASAWDAALHTLNTTPTYQSPMQWAVTIRVMLEKLGFPGQETIDSHGYQVMEAFDAALTQFSRQTPVLNDLSLLATHRVLSRLLRETVFQPQRDPRSRLDVLGFLEAEGGQWDAVWMLGLTDETLPAAVKPNPLLPHSALRRANAPRATPERELQWAQLLFKTLSSSAPVLRLSYPQYQDEQQLRPSPLLMPYPLSEAVETRVYSEPAEIEEVDDQYGPPVAKDERIRGGVSVLDTQARSPLWAFVKYRLYARDLPDYATLSDLNARGLFLHRVMELVWTHCPERNQQGLVQWVGQLGFEGVLRPLIEQAAALELDAYSERLRTLECERAFVVLSRWLEFELSRDAFTVVALESEIRFTHQHLSLPMRLDRIDQLSDGRYVVLDYKTSLARMEPLQEWVRERPVNLQLPLYAAHLLGQNQEVGAVALAWLSSRSPGVNGYADTDIVLGDVLNRDSLKNNDTLLPWAEQVRAWEHATRALADEFLQGQAVNQVWNENDLKFCDVLAFLRLNEEA